ncbi:MAG: DUF1631 family protein, partial [Burkholderiales bacterium]|nr:DUF1631 family protein [Burkholderiales bacterium]
REMQVLQRDATVAPEPQDPALSLVSYEEMDKKLVLGRISRTLELDSAGQYAALNMRFSHLLEREALSTSLNPFRPEVVLNAIHAAWCEFDPDSASHDLILPLLRADILFDLEPILLALNDALIARGVLPDLHESYRVKRNTTTTAGSRRAEVGQHAQDVAQKLRNYLAGAGHTAGGQFAGGHAAGGHPVGGHVAAPTGERAGVAAQAPEATSTRLFQHLADLQKSMALRQLMAGAQDVLRLSQLREQMPDLAGTGVEQHTLALLSQVFDSVFRNQAIPEQIKDLIAVLQVPVLKAALMDSEFFFQESHPARRLIELLSRYSLDWDENKGQQDPLFQTMQRNVHRVQQEFDQQIALFDEVVTDLENFIRQEEAAAEEALQAPIKTALKKEKIKQANIAATHEVAMRVGSGEVVAFVETFLENRWTKVLTLAYSVKDEKPQAVDDAVKTMDDLIWSVKPKINLQQRQELLNRLPAILARLNKWLSLIKWEDADRVQFFADLAACHASIVRAPLDLSPERQVEIAVEVAQKAAERRLARRAEVEAKGVAEAAPDEFAATVAGLERGVWLQLTGKNGVVSKVRLAWVSPMRSLYIFTTSQKEQTFSVAAEELELAFREQRAQLLMLDKVVDRALLEALEQEPEAEPEESIS